ncbi:MULTISPECIES: alanine--tRNA ligase [unclassified Haematospirillum]|uniref:alanine--tRNA ligase n=1 Tax=unclassified Haematospirillum TaxID=2622088 RepID=UPI00143A5093|nr:MULTISPECIES: alanine--tRNA ligase [unclassified Haematospirillum]NKD55448.1 alanine--tRNA ligase [Haematospirillum sp. H4890]NKD75424.1 alanine--tRNA ligase [Haematospirillum sp. H4485]
MKTTNDIRATFLDYFGRHGHQIVESSPLVPRNDPTLMFTNAGMVQFKNVFTGQETRPWTRAASSQKCVRAGGKHNDLDNVGYTARHHTFFEMLGNFSFGDYFKEEAIHHAWTLVTREFGLPADRLLVTVHTSDEDAAGLWRRISGLPDSRIIRIPTMDNFWMMGETGPCGPCSEIFFDHGPGIAGGPPGSADQDGDRFIEIWNLVFMQFEQVDAETRINLPRPSIDTGMGLERFAAILQGKHDNYDIDLMRGLIEAVADVANTDPDGPHKVSHRVIADHLRAACFLIADGVLPSNEGRGYVLRRIMRRAMRHAHIMGCREPVMYRLVPALLRAMGLAFHELERAHALIVETLRLEETRFRQMLERGLRLLDAEKERLPSGGTLPGGVAFTLYDTYGFPLDLTQDALRGEGYTVDLDGFHTAMDQAREKARKSWAGSGEAATDAVWFELRESVGATEFLGYATDEAEGKILALLVDGKRVDRAEAGQTVSVVVNQSPFYGESGGQVGDRGVIALVEGTGRVSVTDTQKKLGDLIVHTGVVDEGALAVGGAVFLKVDTETRLAIRANHSATHLLHTALRRRLGEHVTQKGSLVDADRLRFDIAHPRAVTAAEIAVVEADVNAAIRANVEVVTRLMDPDSAIKAGAMALFGEKYGDEVRVVSMGDVSTELCGGTHVNRTGDIGLLRIVSESAVGAGVRRIEAVTGRGALDWISVREGLLSKAAEALKAAPAEVPDRVAALVEERRRLERELEDLRRKAALGGGAGGQGVEPVTVDGISFVSRLLDDVPGKDLKGIADDLMRQIGSGVVALASSFEGKASLVVAVSPDLASRFNAVDLVRAGSSVVGGKGGGGRPDMAQAGGPDGAASGAALDAIRSSLAG